MAKAKVEGKNLAVYVTGSTWDSNSKNFEGTTLASGEVQARLRKDYILFRIDLPTKSAKNRSEEQRKDEQRVLQAIALRGYQGLPRIALLEPSERIYGRTGPMGGTTALIESLERWEAAREMTSKPTKDAAKAAVLANRAVASRNLQNYVEGQEFATQAITEDPRNPYAWHLLALLSQDLKRPNEALTSYHAALSLDSTGNPSDPTTTIWAAGTWYNLGILALNADQFEAAKFYLRENQRTDLQTDGPMARISERLIRNGSKELAYDEYSELLSRDSLNVDWLRNGIEIERMVFGGKK